MRIKKGFSLAELMVTLGVIGAIAGMTIPTLAYNYRAKVLETQFRSTYSEVMNIGAMINKDQGDVGNFSRKVNYANDANNGAINSSNGSTSGTVLWASIFGSHILGFTKLWEPPSHGATGTPTNNKLREIYRDSGHPGPYRFSSSINGFASIGCNNGGIWSDLKGRIWTFNSENQMVCVDVNGTAPPNRMNIDIFAFIPMSSAQVATWVYGEETESRISRTNYSAQFVLCDLDTIIAKNVSDFVPGEKDHWADRWLEWKRYPKDNPKTALDLCPFNAPVENIAGGTVSSKGRTVDPKVDDYWKKYIDFR